MNSVIRTGAAGAPSRERGGGERSRPGAFAVDVRGSRRASAARRGGATPRSSPSARSSSGGVSGAGRAGAARPRGPAAPRPPLLRGVCEAGIEQAGSTRRRSAPRPGPGRARLAGRPSVAASRRARSRRSRPPARSVTKQPGQKARSARRTATSTNTATSARGRREPARPRRAGRARPSLSGAQQRRRAAARRRRDPRRLPSPRPAGPSADGRAAAKAESQSAVQLGLRPAPQKGVPPGASHAQLAPQEERPRARAQRPQGRERRPARRGLDGRRRVVGGSLGHRGARVSGAAPCAGPGCRSPRRRRRPAAEGSAGSAGHGIAVGVDAGLDLQASSGSGSPIIESAAPSSKRTGNDAPAGAWRRRGGPAPKPASRTVTKTIAPGATLPFERRIELHDARDALPPRLGPPVAARPAARPAPRRRPREPPSGVARPAWGSASPAAGAGPSAGASALHLDEQPLQHLGPRGEALARPWPSRPRPRPRGPCATWTRARCR